MSRRINPTLFLGLVDAAGEPLKTPLFGAVDVSAYLVRRLRRLARMCDQEQLAWIATRELSPPVYWHAGDEVMTEQTATWTLVGSSVYIELTARRRVDGGYGPMEVIGETPIFDLAELVHMREQRIVLDFRSDEVDGETFALEVIRRLRIARIWPESGQAEGDAS